MLAAMRKDTSQDSRVIRLPATEAAELLGVSASAIRKRVERGSMAADKDGRLFVYVDTEETRRATVRDTSHDSAELVAQLRDENAFLRRELERKDAILLSLSEGLKALSPPSEPRDGPVTASEDDGRGEEKGEKVREGLLVAPGGNGCSAVS
jgi:excisionase family DNA binding protein